MSYRRGSGPSEEEMIMQQMMIKLSMGISGQCFKECVTSFSSGQMVPQEATCIQSCAKRQQSAFMAMNDIQGQLQAKQGAGMF
uniref:Protein C2 n=1 Tax=Sterkiella nova TaxID=200597 RepID=C2_STENO|nr:RecName: Full=Protein C2 [Sterkiella nova]AAA64886.1 C2 protein [Sterkiella nova]AAA64887.1 C2 protein [Sterkiella nova]AAA64888.1 C2 protein [Sterkiella nova]